MSLFSVPSMRKLLERPRAPLTENVATPKEYRLVDTPGSVSANDTGFCVGIGKLTRLAELMVPPRTGASVCNTAAVEETSTTLDTEPSSNCASMVVLLEAV